VPVDVAEVARQHLVNTGIAQVRHTWPAPTLEQAEEQVRDATIRRLEEQKAQRDAILAEVTKATPDEWRDNCRRAIWHLATTRSEFTVDDVWDRLAEMGVSTDGDPRSLGPIIMKALRSKAIRDTGRMAQSRRRHGTKITVYERTPQ
jgi:hypothetical protein